MPRSWPSSTCCRGCGSLPPIHSPRSARNRPCWPGTWSRSGSEPVEIFERRLVDIALDAFASLPVDQGPPVLLHQDLHADNVLAGHGGTWLAIDPKPLAGEREFGIAPIVRSAELGTRREDVVRRFDRLTADLALDRRRARLWTIAHAVAWSFETDGVLEMHVNTARWLLEAR